MLLGAAGAGTGLTGFSAWQQNGANHAANGRKSFQQAELPKNDSANIGLDEQKTKPGELYKEMECKLCESRRYQDASSDAGVSFQLATHVAAVASVARVSGHEREHVGREDKKAEENGEKVVASNVRIYMRQCPECKKMYAAGGLTEIKKAIKNPQEQAQSYDFYV